MKNNYFKKTPPDDTKRKYINALDLPTDTIDPQFKEKILGQKWKYLRRILLDIEGGSIALIIIGTFLYFLFNADKVNSTIPTTILAATICGIVIYIGARKLIYIPRRIHNYRNFNFERTCYATIANYRIRTIEKDYTTKRTIYFVDLKINETQYIKNVRMDVINYELKHGDTVIVFSIDGYKKQAFISHFHLNY